METCKWLLWSLAMLGLIISFASAILIFNSTLTEADIYFIANEYNPEVINGPNDEMIKIQKELSAIRIKRTKIGWKLLILGFILQLFGSFGSIPF